MEERLKSIAQACLSGAERHTMTFPEILGALGEGGFESYAIDFRRARAIYYLPDGDSVEWPTQRPSVAIGDDFDVAAIRQSILEAQRLAPGYTYEGFCRKITAAGCVGYTVSLRGRRAVYYGRSAEAHVEHFPT